MATTDGTLPETGLRKDTNWWGAFVIGLAGTILVTGIAPYVVQGTGALGIILIGVMTLAGCFLCLCLAELATMWPDRTGGIPGYATESFRPLTGDTTARHIGGVSGWAYWLGWFPVAPINVILTASYLAVLFNFSPGHLISPVGTTWGTPIGVTIVLVCFALLLVIFIPAWFGIRLGAAFATVLGILSMLPLTAMIFLPFFKPGSIHWSNVAGFHAPPHVAVTVTFIFAWFFPILWNVIAMEAAACYVGECRGGARDAKIALTAEGGFGVFIYIATPLMFVAVLGVALTTADPLTLYLTYTNHIFGPGSWEKWFVGLPLIAALALSVLNAIMGCGRSLFQAAEDGQLPRWFQKKNRHGVPGQAMAFNVVCSAILVLLGSPLRIYIISNGGYLLSCSLALAGYFVYRQLRPDTPRPFRLPNFAKWIALLIFVIWMAIYFFGGWNSPKIVLADPHQGPGLYLLGLADRRAVRTAVLVAGRAGPQAGGGRETPGRPGGRGDRGRVRPCSRGTLRPGIPWPLPPIPWPRPNPRRASRRSPGRGRGMLFGRKRWDRPPTAPAGVLLASAGTPFSGAAVRRAYELAAGQPVAVLTILKVYGSQFGLPNPGLLPTRREREEQYAIVRRAIAAVERRGGTADGQIAATRSAGRTIAKVARRRQVRYVVMDDSAPSGLRRVTEGSVTAIVRRRLGGGAELELVTGAPARNS